MAYYKARLSIASDGFYLDASGDKPIHATINSYRRTVMNAYTLRYNRKPPLKLKDCEPEKMFPLWPGIGDHACYKLRIDDSHNIGHLTTTRTWDIRHETKMCTETAITSVHRAFLGEVPVLDCFNPNIRYTATVTSIGNEPLKNPPVRCGENMLTAIASALRRLDHIPTNRGFTIVTEMFDRNDLNRENLLYSGEWTFEI